jgi:hypothetical protein
MSSDTNKGNDFMDTIKKNPAVTGAVVLIVVLLIIGIVMMMRNKNDKKGDKNKPTLKEGFSYGSNLYDDNDTFALSNMTPEDAERLGMESYSEYSEYDNDIVENFPQTTPMNVMYSDANGNLSTTTDLGLQNLTVNGDSQFANNNVIISERDLGGPGSQTRINKQGIIFGGTNNGRQGDSAQISAGRHDADALCIVGMSKPDGTNRRIHTWAEGGTTHEGPIQVNGTMSTNGTISTNAGYATPDNRNVKPNQLAGGKVQFGFGSMDNKAGVPFADTVHFNGWGDDSGGKPNLVMFNKSTPGMRIYQGVYNSPNAYDKDYKDAVMVDSGGNTSIAGTAQLGNLGTYNGADGAVWGDQNGGLSSWYGIGFRNTLPNGSAAQGSRAQSIEDNKGTSHYFDTRWGHTSMRGNLTVGGGVLNLGNGWELKTVDGVLRFYKDGDQKAAIHGNVGNEWNDVMYAKGGFRTDGPLMTGSWDLIGSNGAGNAGDLSINNTRGNGVSNAFAGRFGGKIVSPTYNK